MGTWSIGSVANAVHAFVDNVPTAMSGGQMIDLADRSREYVQNFTGVTIGSDSIPIKYQSPILNLTIAEVVQAQAVFGSNKGYSLGDLSVEADGTGGASTATAEYFRDKAMRELASLGMRVDRYRTY